MMDLEQLQAVRDRERQSDTLQELRDSFYGQAAELVAELRAERDRAAERADDPFSDSTVRRLSNDIETAEHTIRAIYERRVGKIVTAASFVAAGQSAPETDGMTEEEVALFEEIVGAIRANRERVLKPLDETDAAVPDERVPPDAEDPPAPDPESEPAEAAEQVTDPGTDGESDAESEEIERRRVRITEDVGEIFGVDERAYDLAEDDVVTLPQANADPLIERDAAEPVE